MLSIEDWDDLRWFLETVRAGSIAAAARELGVDPTTVSRRMQAFEARLDAKLFDRLRGGVLVSPAGERLREGALEIEAVVRGLEREAASEETSLSGDVRVAMAEPIALAWAAEFAALGAQWPRLSLQIVVGDKLHSLTRREADIALRASASPPPHLVGRPLGSLAVGAYIAARVGPVDPQTAPWIGWTGHTDDETTIGAVRRHIGAAGPYGLHVDAYSLMVELARGGRGIAALPCVLGEADPGLTRVGPPLTIDRPLWILTHPDLRHTPRIRAVMDAIATIVLAKPEHLTGA